MFWAKAQGIFRGWW